MDYVAPGGGKNSSGGFKVLTIDGHDMDAVTKAYQYAKTTKNGKPKLIVAKTIIGKGIDEIAGTTAAHGEAGVKYTWPEPSEDMKARFLPI